MQRLTNRSRPLRGELVRFGLLGAPGLVLDWQPVDVKAAAPAGDRPRYDEEAVDRAGYLDQTVVPRLERLRWLDVALPEDELLAVRRRIRSVVRDPYAPDLDGAVGAIEDDVARLQESIVADLTESIFVSGWNFGGSAFYGLEEIAAEGMECPNCRARRAARLTFHHRVERALVLRADLNWSTEPDALLSLDGPLEVDAHRSASIVIERKLANNTGRLVRGAIGYAFRNRRFLGLPAGSSAAYRLEAGKVLRYRAVIDLDGHHP